MLVLLVHAVDIVSYEINRLSKGIGALAKNLDGLLHELDVILRKTLASCATSFFLDRGSLSSNLLTESLLLIRSGLLILLSKLSDNLDTTTSCTFILTLRSAVVLLLLHEFLSFSHESTMLLILIFPILLSVLVDWSWFLFLLLWFLFPHLILLDDLRLRLFLGLLLLLLLLF